MNLCPEKHWMTYGVMSVRNFKVQNLKLQLKTSKTSSGWKIVPMKNITKKKKKKTKSFQMDF